MPTRLELEAARHQLGLTTGIDLVKAAEASMLAGAESKSLVLLAGEIDPIMADADPLFAQALDDLNITMPSTDTACWIVLRHHMKRISNNEVSPAKGVRTILDEVYFPGGLYNQAKKYVGDSHDIQHMLGYFYGIDDIRERPDEVSCDGKFGAEAIAAVEAHIRELASRWLWQHGSEQPM